MLLVELRGVVHMVNRLLLILMHMLGLVVVLHFIMVISLCYKLLLLLILVHLDLGSIYIHTHLVKEIILLVLLIP